MRYKACKEAWIKEIPVIIADNLTEEQQREFLIKDNVSGWEWDWDMLANEWDTEELVDWWLDVQFENEEEQKDISENIKEEYQSLINCTNEIEQEEIFEKLSWYWLNVEIKII